MAISESLHWYDQKGEPKYQVPYADPSKGFRNTTLRDAKKEGFVPSVTMILNIPAKPGLDRWKQNQILEAAYTLSQEGLTQDEWNKAVIEKSSEISSQTASIGTAIHANIEQFYIDGTILSPEYVTHVNNVVEALGLGEFVAEKSFGHPLGYGGKVDLYFPTLGKDGKIKGKVYDFKSKDFTEDTPTSKLCWPEQALQLDAYRHGLGMPEAHMISVYIDRETGIVKTYEWPEGNYFEQFQCLLKYWQLSKDYDSSF